MTPAAQFFISLAALGVLWSVVRRLSAAAAREKAKPETIEFRATYAGIKPKGRSVMGFPAYALFMLSIDDETHERLSEMGLSGRFGIEVHVQIEVTKQYPPGIVRNNDSAR